MSAETTESMSDKSGDNARASSPSSSITHTDAEKPGDGEALRRSPSEIAQRSPLRTR